MGSIILYSFIVYFFYHIIHRSDLFKSPRAWMTMALHPKLVYIFNCAFCMTFWVGLFIAVIGWLFTGHFLISIGLFTVAPVINLILDLAVQGLIRYNSPPMITFNTAVSTPQIVWNNNDGYIIPANPDGEKIPPSMIARDSYIPPQNQIPPPPPSNAQP